MLRSSTTLHAASTRRAFGCPRRPGHNARALCPLPVERWPHRRRSHPPRRRGRGRVSASRGVQRVGRSSTRAARLAPRRTCARRCRARGPRCARGLALTHAPAGRQPDRLAYGPLAGVRCASWGLFTSRKSHQGRALRATDSRRRGDDGGQDPRRAIACAYDMTRLDRSFPRSGGTLRRSRCT